MITPGASVRFGVPFTELDTVYFGLGVEQTEIKGGLGLPVSYDRYRQQFGDKSLSVPLTLGWQRDGRDSLLVPTEGRYQRLNVDLGIAGDTRYIRSNYQYQQYWPLSRSYTLGFNGEIGLGKGLSGKPYPVFKNFFGGGLGTVRGFDQNSLGPVDIEGSYIGGTKRINLNTELYVPFPALATTARCACLVMWMPVTCGVRTIPFPCRNCAPRRASASAGSRLWDRSS